MFSKDQSVSFACKQALLRLVHKQWHGVGHSPPQCNTPTGEGAGGDDFDGDDDDTEQERAEKTPPDETAGTERVSSRDQSEIVVEEVLVMIIANSTRSIDWLFYKYTISLLYCSREFIPTYSPSRCHRNLRYGQFKSILIDS